MIIFSEDGAEAEALFPIAIIWVAVPLAHAKFGIGHFQEAILLV
jgi:hypothetical protein